MAHSLQGVYSPLPQSLSDSDSEKEISMEPLCTNYGNNIKNIKSDNSCRQNGHLGFNSINDNILKIKRENPKMSTLRKTAFIFSILLCFLPIIIFLWVLPCSDSNTCPVKISNWEYQRDNIELQGKINLVRGVLQNNLNLLYKGSFNVPKTLKNGIISFKGTNGLVVWDFQQESYPTDMNCSIIDVNGNGFNDCLVVDERGLKAIDAISGEAIWHAHSVEAKFIPELEMPVKLTDFNNDGVSELLSTYKRESFLLLSGKTGLALSNIKISPLCVIINLINDDHKIRYSCRISEKVIKTYEIPFTDLDRKFQSTIDNVTPAEVNCSNKEVFYETGNRKLKVENYDDCPHCRSIVSIYNVGRKLKSWPYQNAFVMTPVPFSFHSNKDNIISLKGHANGFILKIWEWKEFPKKLSPASKVHKRNIPLHNQSYYLNEISERVMLITFNKTDTHIINASLTDIYQICSGPDYQNSCQPDYKQQQNSLLIADMDHDNSQELISYSSSYIKKDDNGIENWHLVSYLKVFRLEDELPKFYGSK